MNGNEIKAIFEQLDERGKRYLEAIAVAELKHAREGAYSPRGAVLNVSAHNYAMEGEKGKNES